MPELIYSKDAKGSKAGRGNRSKGITMEDLKKQTALRLAQENNDHPLHQEIHLMQQHGGQLYPRNLNSNNYAFSSPADQRQLQHLPPRESQDRQHYLVQHPGGYLGVPTYNQMSSMSPQDQNAMPPGIADNHLVESHQTGNCMPRATQPLQPTSSVGLPPNTMYLQHQQPFTSYSPDGPHHARPINRNNSNAIKHKLPHGLTVHELKEMTKARLQSEAIEKSNEYAEMQAVPRDRVSPLDFESSEPLRDRTMSRDSSSAGRINTNQVASYVHQNHQVAPNMIQTQHLQPQSQMGFHPNNGLGGATPSSFRAAASRTDTWESTSVASHNSTSIYSDNLGSESASDGSFGHHSNHRNRSFTYPATQAAHSLDVTNSSAPSSGYKESRSFSNPSPVQASPHRGAGLIGGQSLFNAAVGGNRRRAVTLSPNTGSILEDKPVRYDSVESGDRLEIPHFSSGLSETTSLSAALPTQNLNRGYSPVLEQLGLGLDNSYVSNGTETSNVFRGSAIKNGSSLPGISRMGSIEQEIHRAFPSNTTNNTSVFRSPSAAETRAAAAPPPGFTTLNASPSGQTAFSRVASMDGYCNINRKDSWEPSKISNQINISDLSPEATLVADFGSLLDLSGSYRRDRERASTYTFGSSQSHGNKSPQFKDGSRF